MAPATLLVDRIEEIIEQTGETGFHFVDEAAPPLALRDLAIELIKRNVKISWWANIRFEKTFTHDLCILLTTSYAQCIVFVFYSLFHILHMVQARSNGLPWSRPRYSMLR